MDERGFRIISDQVKTFEFNLNRHENTPASPVTLSEVFYQIGKGRLAHTRPHAQPQNLCDQKRQPWQQEVRPDARRMPRN